MSDTNAKTIRIVLIDDHRSVLWGLEKLIESQYPNMQVVGKFTSYEEASTQLKSLSPNLVLLDLDLGSEQGIDIIPQLITHANVKILILTGSRDTNLHDQAIIAGAKGIVQKESSPDIILTAIKEVSDGQFWIDKDSVGRIFVELTRKKSEQEVDPDTKKIESLTPRELNVVIAVTERSSTTGSEVAKMLHIGESTLRNHLSSIYSKLELSNRLELWDFAHKHGINKEK